MVLFLGVCPIWGTHLWQQRGKVKPVKRMVERLKTADGQQKRWRVDPLCFSLCPAFSFILIISALHVRLFRDSPQRLFNHAEGASLPQSFYVHLYIFSFCYWPLTEIYSHSQQHTPKVHNVMHKRLSASLVFIGAFSKAGDCALLTGKPLLSLSPRADSESRVGA